MSEMYKYGSINQFRNLIREVDQMARFRGLDENGEPIVDRSAVLPTLTFTGTTKAHGTNSSIVLTADGDYYAQTKERVLSLMQDNADFFVYAMQNKEYFTNLIRNAAAYDVLYTNNPGLLLKAVVLAGEWCGGNIQSGVAITGLPKMFLLFEVKFIYEDGSTKHHPSTLLSLQAEPEIGVFPVGMFKTWSIDIDFNNPEQSTNQLIQWTDDVEKECPIGKYFGVSGVGEGIVYTGEYKGNLLRMKVKGEKHSTSKVKTTAAVDVELINSVKEFVEYTVTENRLEQAITVMRESCVEPTDKSIGQFLKWINGDIAKEEMDTIVKNGFDMKMVAKYASAKAKTWYMGKYF